MTNSKGSTKVSIISQLDGTSSNLFLVTSRVLVRPENQNLLARSLAMRRYLEVSSNPFLGLGQGFLCWQEATWLPHELTTQQVIHLVLKLVQPSGSFATRLAAAAACLDFPSGDPSRRLLGPALLHSPIL